MLAKLQREKHLQDTDSDMGSLPSIAFIKRGDSGHGDHKQIMYLIIFSVSLLTFHFLCHCDNLLTTL